MYVASVMLPQARGEEAWVLTMGNKLTLTVASWRTQ